MSGDGRKVWSAGDILTAQDLNGYVMDQAVMNFAGTAARASAIPSPSAGMVTHIGGGTVQVYNGTAWVALGGVPNAVLSNTPTGNYSAGTPSVNYNYFTFTASGTATVTTAGFADVLLVAGGGGGGCHFPDGTAGWYTTSGGGGGGQIVQRKIFLTAGSHTVTVGAGGTSRPNNTNNNALNATQPGGASRIGTGNDVLQAIGGGQGEGSDLSSQPAANTGGAGEFKYPAVSSFFGRVGQSITGLGFVGGTPATTGGASGGGGAGANGANGSSNTGGNGGNGVANDFTGSSVTYGGGGGGGGISAGGSGGTGGGGAGATTGTPTNGSANTGGGGGGLYRTTTTAGAGSTGGSGIVVIRVAT